MNLEEHIICDPVVECRVQGRLDRYEDIDDEEVEGIHPDQSGVGEEIDHCYDDNCQNV